MKPSVNHLTQLAMRRRLARMLAASTASPKPRSKPTPTPANWSGVTQGFIAAKKAFHSHALEEAESILLDILSFAPAEAKAWAWLGQVMQAQGQAEHANQHFQKAKSLLTNHHYQQHQEASSLPLARILWQQGELALARSMLATLLVSQPDNETLQQLSLAWKEPT